MARGHALIHYMFYRVFQLLCRSTGDSSSVEERRETHKNTVLLS